MFESSNELKIFQSSAFPDLIIVQRLIELELTTVYKMKWIVHVCVLVGHQLCFYGAVKHVNEMSDMTGCLQVVRFSVS